MGEIIHIDRKSEGPPENLITRKPFEFRRADWDNLFFIQMLKSQSAILERHREEMVKMVKMGKKGIGHIPPCFHLKGGMAYTMQGIYGLREDEKKMRKVYYLAGLVDCMINQVSPLLRTDLLRDMYRKILELKGELRMNWFGQLDQVLFPIDQQLYNLLEYRKTLSEAKTMKEIYHLIRQGMDEMFDILSLEYTFYTPGRG